MIHVRRRAFLSVIFLSLFLPHTTPIQAGLKGLIIGGVCISGTAVLYASGTMKNVLLCLTDGYRNDHYKLKKQGYKTLKKEIIYSNGTSIISVLLGQQNYPLKSYKDDLGFNMFSLFLLKLPYLWSESGEQLSKRLSKMCELNRAFAADQDLYNECRQHEILSRLK